MVSPGGRAVSAPPPSDTTVVALHNDNEQDVSFALFLTHVCTPWNVQRRLTAATNSRWNRLILANPSVCTCRSLCVCMIAYRCQSVSASPALRVQTFITAQNNSFVSLSWQRTPMTCLAAAAASEVRVSTVSECLNLRYATTCVHAVASLGRERGSGPPRVTPSRG